MGLPSLKQKTNRAGLYATTVGELKHLMSCQAEVCAMLNRASVKPLLRIIFLRQVLKLGELRFELQFNNACRAMTLLADDDFGAVVGASGFFLPLQVFRRAGVGFFDK